MTGIKRLILAAAAAMTVTTPVSAACWSNGAVEAAYVRDLDTMMMVATLRCRTQDAQIGASYNKFVRAKRAVLIAANDELRAQFTAGRSAKGALDAFDRYATSLANAHGAGTAGVSCAEYKALIDSAVSAPVTRAALLQLATRAGSKPDLPEATCTRQIALAR